MQNTLPKPDRRFGIQWRPNFVRSERRLVLTRICWNRGTPGDGKGYSVKLTVSLCWAWYDLWVGLFVKRETFGFILFLCLLPCLPIRIHYQRSYGGRYI